MPAADDDTFVSLAHVLRPQPVSEAAVPIDIPAVPAPPADVVDVARDVRVFRAQLADAFDAGLAREVDALLAGLLERLS